MDDLEIVSAMKCYGGSFVQALAEAWLRADQVNRLKIVRAWPEIWLEYAELAQQAKKVRS